MVRQCANSTSLASICHVSLPIPLPKQPRLVLASTKIHIRRKPPRPHTHQATAPNLSGKSHCKMASEMSTEAVVNVSGWRMSSQECLTPRAPSLTWGSFYGMYLYAVLFLQDFHGKMTGREVLLSDVKQSKANDCHNFIGDILAVQYMSETPCAKRMY